MTDTKESHWSDRADLRAENARLRAEVERLTAEWQPVAEALSGAGDWRKLGSPVDYVNELRAELAEARKSLDALRAAPSDAEIEAWERQFADYVEQVFNGEVGAIGRKVRDAAVALMRRANAHRPAPAASPALREAAEWALRAIRDRDVGARVPDIHDISRPNTVVEALTVALAAEPEAQPAIAVPEDVRHLAEEFDRFDRMVPGSDACRVSSGRNLVRAILSLPAGAAPQPEARADGECEVAGGAERVCERGTQDCITLHTPLPGSDAELQQLLDEAREALVDGEEPFTGAACSVFRVAEALARKAGAK